MILFITTAFSIADYSAKIFVTVLFKIMENGLSNYRIGAYAQCEPLYVDTSNGSLK